MLFKNLAVAASGTRKRTSTVCNAALSMIAQRQLANQIIIKAEGDAQQTLVSNQADMISTSLVLLMSSGVGSQQIPACLKGPGIDATEALKQRWVCSGRCRPVQVPSRSIWPAESFFWALGS